MPPEPPPSADAIEREGDEEADIKRMQQQAAEALRVGCRGCKGEGGRGRQAVSRLPAVRRLAAEPAWVLLLQHLADAVPPPTFHLPTAPQQAQAASTALPPAAGGSSSEGGQPAGGGAGEAPAARINLSEQEAEELFGDDDDDDDDEGLLDELEQDLAKKAAV